MLRGFHRSKKILKEEKDQWEEKIGFLTSDEEFLDDDEIKELTKLVKPKGKILSQSICEANIIEKIKLQDISNALFINVC